MELQDYLRVVRRRWRIIVVCLAVCLGAGLVFTLTATPVYSSNARLFVSATGPQDASTALAGSQLAAGRATAYADLVPTEQLARLVGEELEFSDDQTARLPGQVEALVLPGAVSLSLTVTESSAERAQALAEAYASELQGLIRDLETPDGEGTAPVEATVVEPGTMNATPISPRPLRNLGLAFVLGLLLGLGSAVVRELLDNTVRSEEQASQITGARVLAAIADDRHGSREALITSLDSMDPRVEQFRLLRNNMRFVDVDGVDRGKVFVVSSCLAEESKTETAVNLALSIARSGQSVALVEGDLRRPLVSETVGLDDQVGLTSVLLGQLSLGAALQTHGDTELAVLPSGPLPPDPGELVQSPAMGQVLSELKATFDVVIVDAPPVLSVTDAALLGSGADGVLLVLQHGKTTAHQLTACVERLTSVRAALVGLVMTKAPRSRRQPGAYAHHPEQVDKAASTVDRVGKSYRESTSTKRARYVEPPSPPLRINAVPTRG